MGKKRETAGGTRRAFVFSYREHEWIGDIDGQEAAEQALLQVAAQETWNLVETTQPSKIESYTDPDVESVDDLREQVRAFLVDECGLPEGAVRVAFDKLAALTAREGWAFVSGTFYEFEGNHNDTEVYAVLEKQ